MILDDKTIWLTDLFSSENLMQEVYENDLPENILKMFNELNDFYKKTFFGMDYIKIIPGKEIVNGKPITKRRCGETYVCYVDRLPEEEVEEMRRYNEEKKKEFGIDFVFFVEDK